MSNLVQLLEFKINLDTGDVCPVEPIDKPVARLEPKAIAVLSALINAEGGVVSKQALFESAWPNAVVTDDALLRVISQLRKTFGDSARAPRYIATIPKRGYQLIPAATPIEQSTPKPGANKHPSGSTSRYLISTLIAAGIASFGIVWWAIDNNSSTDPNGIELRQQLDRADDYYHQMRQADNEMAIALYEQTIASYPDSADALAGLANGLVQRILRWSELSPKEQQDAMELALKEGTFESEQARATLNRANALAQRAVEMDPTSARARKALGFVFTAQNRLEAAQAQYQMAIEIDPNEWPSLINLADISDLKDEPRIALNFMEQAFDAMTERYNEDVAQIRPWYPEIGTNIAHRYQELGELEQAERWYRRVLEIAPLHVDATLGLAEVLALSGDQAQATQLCNNLRSRLGEQVPCRR